MMIPTFSSVPPRPRLLRLLHKEMLPQAALKGREEGQGRRRPEVGPAAGQHVQGQGKVFSGLLRLLVE